LLKKRSTGRTQGRQGKGKKNFEKRSGGRRAKSKVER